MIALLRHINLHPFRLGVTMSYPGQRRVLKLVENIVVFRLIMKNDDCIKLVDRQKENRR